MTAKACSDDDYLDLGLLSKVLFKVQKESTLYNPIITYKYDRFKNPVICYDGLTDKAYELFKKTDAAKSLTVIDDNPHFFTDIVINAYKNVTEKILIPNGCCTSDECPIKIYTEIVLNLMKP